MKLYDIYLDSGEWVVVIATSIRNALELAELQGATAIECNFIMNIDNLIVEKSVVDGSILYENYPKKV